MFFASAGILEGFSLARLGPNFSLKEGIAPGNFLNVKNVYPYSDALEVVLYAELSDGADCSYVGSIRQRIIKLQSIRSTTRVRSQGRSCATVPEVVWVGTEA